MFRWRDRDLGFLLPLAASGLKIQVQHLRNESMIIEYYGDFAIHEQWYTCARFRFFVKEWIKWTSQVHLHYLFLVVFKIPFAQKLG